MILIPDELMMKNYPLTLIDLLSNPNSRQLQLFRKLCLSIYLAICGSFRSKCCFTKNKLNLVADDKSFLFCKSKSI